MIALLATMAALAGAPDSSAETAPIYDVEFAPLLRSERRHARLGPAGPFYPEAAAASSRSGEATLECVAAASGALKRCKVLSETPGGLSFGVAARVMADRGRIIAAGSPLSGEIIRVRVPFTIGAPASVAP